FERTDIQVFLGKHVQHRKPDMGRQRIRYMRSDMDVVLGVAISLDLVGGYCRRQRQSTTECLRQGQDIGLNAEVLKGEVAAESAEGGLGLVEDQQHAPVLALLLDLPPITVRRNDDAARAFDWLSNQR